MDQVDGSAAVILTEILPESDASSADPESMATSVVSEPEQHALQETEAK